MTAHPFSDATECCAVCGSAPCWSWLCGCGWLCEPCGTVDAELSAVRLLARPCTDDDEMRRLAALAGWQDAVQGQPVPQEGPHGPL